MNKVVETAKKYLNSRELTGNRFIDDPKVQKDLGELIIKAGQKPGEAWCSYFAEAMFCEAYPEKEKQLRKVFNPGAVATYNAFVASGIKGKATPVVGDLVIFQHYENGKPQWQGHAAIVSEVFPNGTFKTVEGNTNEAGGREGIGVFEKTRSGKKVTTGLNLLGFLTIA